MFGLSSRPTSVAFGDCPWNIAKTNSPRPHAASAIRDPRTMIHGPIFPDPPFQGHRAIKLLLISSGAPKWSSSAVEAHILLLIQLVTSQTRTRMATPGPPCLEDSTCCSCSADAGPSGPVRCGCEVKHLSALLQELFPGHAS